MNIDTASIEGYADMTPEQKVEALEKFEYDDNAAELERFKNANSKLSSENADWKRKYNDLASDEDRKKAEAEEANKKILEELEGLRRDKTIANYTSQYLGMGYSKELAEDTAKAMADGDMDKVFANGVKHREALEKEIKEKLMNGTPKPSGAGGNGDDKADSAVEKAKELAKAKNGGGKQYEDIMKNYRK